MDTLYSKTTPQRYKKKRTQKKNMKTIQTKKTNKRLAAEKLLDTYNSYEVRKVKIETILRKMFWDKKREQWRIIGHAHDYSC